MNCATCKGWTASTVLPYGICRRIPSLYDGAESVIRTDEDGEEYIRPDAPSASVSGGGGLRTLKTFSCCLWEKL